MRDRHDGEEGQLSLSPFYVISIFSYGAKLYYWLEIRLQQANNTARNNNTVLYTPIVIQKLTENADEFKHQRGR